MNLDKLKQDAMMEEAIASAELSEHSNFRTVKASPSEVERTAEVIYNAFPYDEIGVKPAWYPNGNSEMQNRARLVAKDILTSLEAKHAKEMEAERKRLLHSCDFHREHLDICDYCADQIDGG